MVKIQKEFNGIDGDTRTWYLDSDEKLLIYKGFAKDFQLTKNMDAQDFIDEAERREEW